MAASFSENILIMDKNVETMENVTDGAGEKLNVKKPTCVIVLGMAGSGKTTFVNRIAAHLTARKTKPYVINLDPACHDVPYPVNIDIRDTVKYKEVMKQYSLGPNGGIITSLNLFSTKFDAVVNLIEKRSSDYEYIIFDTPGQIEVFTWSASGTIITETLASVFPTVIVYVMDIVRSVNPVTFMSNMLYACSILYKAKLPFVVALNKIDVTDPSFAFEWIRDFEVFQEAIQKDTTYAANLAQSMSLVLDEFYKDLRAVGVSAVTGVGMKEFVEALGLAREEYLTEYKPQYERLKADKEKKAQKKHQDEQMQKLDKDMTLREKVTKMLFSEVRAQPKQEHVFIEQGGGDIDEEEMETEEEEDEEEKKEYEAFKKEFGIGSTKE